jgi:ABC-type sugar transport system ATPase subunit
MTLEGISFVVRKGECVALMGKSGIGKSTLLRIISGLVLPQARLGHGGTISIRQANVTDTARKIHVPPHERAVGVAFQKGVGLQEQRTVAENIQYPLNVIGTPLTDADRLSLVETFALWPAEDDADAEDAQRFWHSRVDLLSGGQRQRVALARCFARSDRALYLLDEPLDGQDNPLRQKLIVNLRDLFVARQDAGFVIVTHRMAEAFSLAHRIIYFDTDSDGVVRVVAEGPPAELYDCPQHLSVARFLGDPAMNVVTADALARERVPTPHRSKWDELAQKKVIALLRPEQVAIGESADTCDFVHVGEIKDRRRSGGERILRIELKGYSHEPFHVVAPKGYSMHTDLRVGWNWDQLHLFQQSTGKRLP